MEGVTGFGNEFLHFAARGDGWIEVLSNRWTPSLMCVLKAINIGISYHANILYTS